MDNLNFKILFFLFIVQLPFLTKYSNLAAANSGINTFIDQHPGDPLAEVLFIANINGVIENCDCGNPPLGGLVQISSLIHDRTTNRDYVYFIDGGDFLNTYPYPLLDNAIIDIYNKLNLTFLALGDQEWIDDVKIDQRVFTSLKDKIIAGNYTIPGYNFKSYGKINLSNGKNAFILSYLDKNAFYVDKDLENIKFNDTGFTAEYNNLSKSDNLIILIYHGTKKILNRIIQDYPAIDLILFAHEQNNNYDIDNRPAVVGGGSDGEYVKSVKIYGDSAGYKYTVESIPVSAGLKGDEKISRIVDEFRTADEAQTDGN